MRRITFSSGIWLAANGPRIVRVEHGVCPRLPDLCRPFFTSTYHPFWSTASSQAPSSFAIPLGIPFSDASNGSPVVTDVENVMGSMMKVEPQSSLNKIEESGEILEPRDRRGKLIERQIGDNLSRRDKCRFLLETFSELKDSKEAVYGALDAWVAWERDFPVPAIRRALIMLEKDEQWHRIIQVIKWMLSKGQGNTMGTYEQLIRALEKDHRAEEAHSIWVQKFSYDMHSAPWRVCELMISIYYRNDMLDRLVKLFKKLEAFGRKPPKKSIVRKVADAYEVQGLLDEKHKLMEKYNYLFKEPTKKLSGNHQKKSIETKKDDSSEKAGAHVSPEDADASLRLTAA